MYVRQVQHLSKVLPFSFSHLSINHQTNYLVSPTTTQHMMTSPPQSTTRAPRIPITPHTLHYNVQSTDLSVFKSLQNSTPNNKDQKDIVSCILPAATVVPKIESQNPPDTAKVDQLLPTDEIYCTEAVQASLRDVCCVWVTSKSFYSVASTVTKDK